MSLAFTIVLSAAMAMDPFEGTPHSTTDTMIRSAQFGEPGADARIVEWLASHPAAEKTERMSLEHRLCADFDVRSAHAAAATACAAATQLGADNAQAATNNLRLRDIPPIRAIGSTTLQLHPNDLGNRDATVTVNGVNAPWIMDTGAQITVVSASLATRVGLRMLDSRIRVGSATGNVQGGLAVIDVLKIGDAQVENVPVLVLPDAQLKIGELPQIHAILGLPVFAAFRRAAWLDGGKVLALGDAAPETPAKSPRLYWHDEGIGLPISTALGIRGAHLDTGANASFLRAPAHALLDRAMEASATTQKERLGGAGGVVAMTQKVYPRLMLNVAGVPVQLTNVSIDEQSSEGAARLGDDVVRCLARLVLDFEHMRVQAIAPTPH